MTNRQKRIAILAVLILITLAFHSYSHILKAEPGQSNFMKHVLADLCYIPIIVAAIWFGIRGTAISTTIIAVFALIIIILYPSDNPTELRSDYIEIIFYYLVGGVAGIVLDKDRRLQKLLEETQSHAARYNRSLIEAGLDPLVTIGPDGRITDVNKATETATGFDRKDLIGTDFCDYFTQPERARDGYKQVFMEGTVRDFPLEIKHQDGHITPVLYNASLYRDEGGNVIGIFAAARDITERKQAEKAVRESERQYRALFTNMMAGFALYEVVLDKSGSVCDLLTIEINPAYEEIVGTKRDEVIGKRVLEILPEFSKNMFDTYDRVYKTGQPIRMERYRQDLDKHFETFAYSPSKGKIAVNFIDITERKSDEIKLAALAEQLQYQNEELQTAYEEVKIAEEALRGSSAYNRSLLEASLDPLVTIGPDGRITDVNKATEMATGLDRKDLIGTDFSDYFTEPEQARAGYQRVFRDGFVRDYPLKIKHRDGHIISVLYNATVYRDEKGNVNGIFAAARDVTEQKKLEEVLWKTNELLESTVSAIDEHLVYLDKYFYFIRVNRAYAKTYGHSEDYFPGKNYFSLYPNAENEAIFREVARTGKPFSVVAKPFEFPDQPERGTTYWDWSLHPVFEPDGSVGGLVLSMIDVTQRERAARELALKNAALAAANSELQQFAYIASHDLQEPLRMISSYLQLLEKRYKDHIDSDANDFIDFAVDGAKRLQNMINSLLLYSRVGTQGSTFKLESTRNALDQAIDNLKIAIEESKAQIVVEDLPEVFVDIHQIIQLFQNLIGNAIKFRGVDVPKIHISAELQNGQWLFKVADNGIGIDKEYREIVFNIFRRLHGANYPGTGIGLALCKRIVERHGGRIWVESEPGKGTSFNFTLPAGQEPMK